MESGSPTSGEVKRARGRVIGPDVLEAVGVWVSRALALAAAIAVVVRLGGESSRGDAVLPLVESVLIGAYWLTRLLTGNRPPVPRDWPRAMRRLASLALGRMPSDAATALRLFDVPMLLLLLAGAAVGGATRGRENDLGLWLFEASIGLTFGVELVRAVRAGLRALPAPVMLPLWFGSMIVACAGLLKLPACTPDGITWTDAVFTATSAVCVTGLVVRDTGMGFTDAGQAVIMVFIQLGALGIVLFGAGLSVVFRRAILLREHVSMRELLERGSIGDLRGFVVFVLLATLAIQAVGAGVMMPLWRAEDGQALSMGRRVWLSVFHSVSAFCNAGFDLTGSSMTPYRNAALPYVAVMPLIVLGGIGFPVLGDVFKRMKSRARGPKAGRWKAGRLKASRGGRSRAASEALSLHSRLTLTTTAVVLGAGFVAILIAQNMGAHATTRSWLGEIADAAFLAVTPRSAGLTTVPMEELTPASVIVVIGLMFVGGSPGSAAGGMRTTTLAVLVLSILATVRARSETEAYGRAIPETQVRKAGAIAMSMMLLAMGSAIMLAMTDPGPIGPLVFEAVSAATTTGLSLGITSDLSNGGRSVLIATMLLGRIGPLALLGALVLRRPGSSDYAYPRESVNLS